MAVFKRKIYDALLGWKEEYDGKCALMVEGARRVGKTTVVTEFARNEYERNLVIDFSEADEDILALFNGPIGDIDRFLGRLQQFRNAELVPRRSVVVFDEVQFCPRARQKIKRLVADGRFDYIETGSLISIKRNVKDIMIPSEEIKIQMHPMDFEEFLWALGDSVTVPAVRGYFDELRPLEEPYHRRVLDMYREYMVVGGMPQAVSEFTEGKSYRKADSAKRAIMQLYYDDLGKIGGATGLRAKRLFDFIPSMLSGHDKTFRPGRAEEGTETADHLNAIEWLRQSRTVNVCFNNTDPTVAMNLDKDATTLKLYMADTGLLFFQSMSEGVSDPDTTYKDVLSGRLSINRGMFFENVVAQELVARGYELQFSKFKVAGRTNLQEVDFIIADGKKTIPVEVKSGISGKHASLDMFMKKFGKRIGRAYVVHSKNLRVDQEKGVVYIPVYMAMFL